jgi:hypothetical protein
VKESEYNHNILYARMEISQWNPLVQLICPNK